MGNRESSINRDPRKSLKVPRNSRADPRDELEKLDDPREELDELTKLETVANNVAKRFIRKDPDTPRRIKTMDIKVSTPRSAEASPRYEIIVKDAGLRTTAHVRKNRRDSAEFIRSWKQSYPSHESVTVPADRIRSSSAIYHRSRGNLSNSSSISSASPDLEDLDASRSASKSLDDNEIEQLSQRLSQEMHAQKHEKTKNSINLEIMEMFALKPRRNTVV